MSVSYYQRPGASSWRPVAWLVVSSETFEVLLGRGAGRRFACRFGGGTFGYGRCLRRRRRCTACRRFVPDLGYSLTSRTVQLEEGHHALQLFGLAAHLFSRRCQFFRSRRILLRGLVELTHGAVDLCHSTGLFRGGRGDLLHQFRG